MNLKNKNIIYLSLAILVGLLGYFYLAKSDNKTPEQEANISEQYIDPKEILKYDPDAPEWMKEAESCKLVAGKIFCKMPGE